MATGDKKRAVMTDDINNSGSSYPVMPLKTIDQTPTAGNTDHLISSAGVKSAIENPPVKYLGPFSTLAELASLLDTEIASMSTFSLVNIRVYSAASAQPFGSGTTYVGTLFRPIESATACPVILYSVAQSLPPVICRRIASGWDFKRIDTNYIYIISKSSSLSLSFSLYAQAIVFAIGYRDTSMGAYLLCRTGNSALANVPLSAASNITISINSNGVVTIANADTISPVNIVLTPIQGTITEAT